MRKRSDSTGHAIDGAEHRLAAARLRPLIKRLDAAVPIGVKLAVPMLAIAAISGTVLALTVYRSEADRIHRDYESRAVLIGQDVRGAVAAQRLAGAPLHGASTGLQRHIDTLVELEPSILHIDLYDMSGGSPEVVASSDHTHLESGHEEPADFRGDLEAAETNHVVSHEDTVGSEPALHVSVPFRVNGQAPFLVAVHLSTAERDRALASLLRNFAVGFGVSLVLTTVALVAGVHVLIMRRIARVARGGESPAIRRL